jgi:hypothetical protein
MLEETGTLAAEFRSPALSHPLVLLGR